MFSDDPCSDGCSRMWLIRHQQSSTCFQDELHELHPLTIHGDSISRFSRTLSPSYHCRDSHKVGKQHRDIEHNTDLHSIEQSRTSHFTLIWTAAKSVSAGKPEFGRAPLYAQHTWLLLCDLWMLSEHE